MTGTESPSRGTVRPRGIYCGCEVRVSREGDLSGLLAQPRPLADPLPSPGYPAGLPHRFARHQCHRRHFRSWQPIVSVAALVALMSMASQASAAQCGSTAAGFEAWKKQFADEARGRGVSASTAAALMATTYSSATIAADRGQRSFGLSLDQFLAKRGGSAIIARGRALKRSNAALFASVQQRFGVPPGPLLAIWGMETGFGRSRGNQNTLSAVATLAYDCRRTAYFTEQLYATLTLIDRRILSASTRGSMHGEIGHTQFLPKSILNYGTGGNLDVAANALSSTANFLRGHGWRAGAGYQPGQTNFGAIQAWNAAPVYQRAIALIGQQIDGGDGTSARP